MTQTGAVARTLTLFKALPLTLFTQREWGGFTEQKDGDFYFTGPSMGGSSSFRVADEQGNFPPGLKTGTMRVYHTHRIFPNSDNTRTFSVDDISFAAHRYPEKGHVYLGNNFGDFRIGSGFMVYGGDGNGGYTMDFGAQLGEPWTNERISGAPTNDEYWEILECLGSGEITP